ncbi:3-oxoadipate enol-lactonase [Jiella sp. MQZ9-1]|uniref:3-oxoadipate enol-lactonase n=1 Tax=Jiella flava TaxID=2816857 RepID=A0A939FXY3_9HYPH|nr:3-oxoadipate enol-lactonase [Jiella flava]MBO0663555.1 3-oxoadipate enol-lactonase [Jiella flava]MCD2472130.1 3-oxoadipate enol-lactonase [Jiella flava]
MPFDRINDIVIHHRIDGPANAPTLVLVNSLGTDFRIWDSIMPQLTDRCRVIRYDKRGHGLSEVPPAPYRMDEHSADLLGLLDHHHIDAALVVGLSIGGPIALGLAAMAPERLAGLVMMDTAPKIGDDASWNGRITAIEDNGIAAIAEQILTRWFTPAFRTADNPAFVGYRNMLLNSPVAGYLGSCAALRDADHTETARALRLPTLCMVGDQDGSTPPALVKACADLIANSRFEVVAGAGHLPCIEQPDATARLLSGFAASVFGQDAAA